ncbi:MFS transporter [Granulicella mallensis]|uniref:MFS family permease n=1 Tax=Granulicella mallensis TaxID=940614 RepID=A0A7W7ZU52_9BACT|nr:MFS transporter [Granulicella mallensis]MBB5066202.1 MFS family permease [Granulicella mallensis]
MTTAPTPGMKSNRSAIAGATVALVLLTGMNFVNYLDRYILPAVQEQVKGEFRLSDDQIGSLTLWFFVAYVLSSPITGWLGDRFPRKPMIVIAALGISAMNFFTASVHGYLSLNIRHAALGVVEASFGIFAPALLADFYAEDRRNTVLTIFNVAIPVGAALGFLTGGMIGHSHGWRMAFIASAVPGALIALLILFFMKEPQRTGSGQDKAVADKASVLSLLTNKAYLCSILGYAAVTFSLGGISWWMVSFLQRINGFSQDRAGTVMGGITVVCGLGGTVCGGVLAQWWSKKSDKALYLVPALSALLAVPPAVLCFFGPKSMTLPALGVAVFLVFLGTGPVNAATLNAVPANLRASAMAGQLFAIHVFGDAFSPKIIGIVSDHSNLRLGLGVTLITFVLAAIIFFIGAQFAPRLKHTLEAPAAA